MSVGARRHLPHGMRIASGSRCSRCRSPTSTRSSTSNTGASSSTRCGRRSRPSTRSSRSNYLKQLRSYLRGVQLPTGEIVLSLPLGGEGRSILQGQHSIAIGFPDDRGFIARRGLRVRARGRGRVAEQAVRERIAPAEFRAGLGAQLESAGESARRRDAPAARDPRSWWRATSDTISRRRAYGQRGRCRLGVRARVSAATVDHRRNGSAARRSARRLRTDG